MEFARGTFELNAPQGDGATLRTHLLRLAQSTGTRDPRLDVECPPAGRAIWGVFSRLGRPSGGSGFAYITQQEIAAYMANYGVRLTPWELDAIHALDNAAAHVWAKHKQAQQQAG